MNKAFPFNPLDAEIRRDPYALYELGRKAFPVFVHEDLRIRLTSLFRYADVQAVQRDWEQWFSVFDTRPPPPEIAALGDMGPPSMMGTEGDEHTRLRGLINKAFTPRIVERLKPRLIEVAGELLDEALEKGEADLIEAFSYPLPVIAIAEIIGIPREDHEQFKVWTDVLVSSLGAGLFSAPNIEGVKKHLATRQLLNEYFIPLVENRALNPQDDLITGLVQAEHEGSRLTLEEMLTMLSLVLVAGNETTTTLIGNAVIELLNHPHELKRLREDMSLLPRAIDEVLRFASPVQFSPRRATSRTKVADVEIEKDEIVLCWLGSANRDEEIFDHPETFDISREKNPHLAFGYGSHHCLGHNLARLEAAVAIGALLKRTRSFERTDVGDLPLHPSPVFRSVTKLPVLLVPA